MDTWDITTRVGQGLAILPLTNITVPGRRKDPGHLNNSSLQTLRFARTTRACWRASNASPDYNI